tara:strand:+ start:1418 stop:2431 length:1014 start_codon:yes stop_codon:yes gene_type:complete
LEEFDLDWDQFHADDAADLDTLYGLPHAQDQAALWVMPVPFEATTSFGKGTAKAPQQILQASWQVDLFDLETGNPWQAGLFLLPENPSIKALNTKACERIAAYEQEKQPGLLDEINAMGDALEGLVHEQTQATYAAQKIPAVLGGDHSVPLGAIKAASALHDDFGILHIDAHADLRKAYQGYTHSHASIFYNVMTQCEVNQLVQVGIRDLGQAEYKMAQTDPRIHLHSDLAIQDALAQGQTFAGICHRMLQPLPQNVWVSFDIDGLDPALCPRTGTPVPGGLQFREALTLLAALGQSGRNIVGFDLVEVGNHPWDANVGARLLYKMAGWALKSQHKI